MTRWDGLTVCCIGSGPSLTAGDCGAVRDAGLKVIAVNSAFVLAPFADVIYGGDLNWWRANRARIDTAAELWTCNKTAAGEFGLQRHEVFGAYNSGMRALQLAAARGARRVLLLGYDCQLTDGRKHFHPDHVGLPNPTAIQVKKWQVQFTRLARALERQKVEVWNCSRQTALFCFPRAPLEQALEVLCESTPASCAT